MDNAQIKQEAATKIEEAFADTPMPQKGRYWEGPHECEDIEDHIGGIHWRDVPLQTLSWWRDCINYLTPEAFRFYVPAYMLMVLLHPIEGDTLVDNIVGCLSPSGDFHNRHLKEQSKFVKPKEAEGIIAFLEAYQSLMDADDPYFSDNYGIYHHKRHLEDGILFWTSVRNGIDVSL